MQLFTKVGLRRLGKLIVLFTACLYSATSSLADPVYRSTDQKGVPVYSSKPREKGAEPASLPKIARAPVGEVMPNNMTCVGHGGINCQAGADTDGSVLCYDNFKDSMQRFAFSCSAARLVIIPESKNKGQGKFSVVVRNTSAVAARAVKVVGPKGLTLEGPKELEPYGSASYSCKQEVERNVRFQASCDNCN